MSSYTISNTALNPNRIFILQKSELEKRWDPNTYHLERRNIIEALKKSGHQLEALKFVSTFKKSIVKEIPSNTPYLGLENIESNTGSYIPTSDKESISSAIEFKKGQVLFPKLRPYLNKVYFAEFDGVCSTEFHVLDSKKVSNEFLANFLRTNLVVNQTKYLMSGNTLPRLQTEDIESLLIPILKKEDEEKVNAIMRYVFAQKQKNEAQADKLLSSIDDYLLNELGIKLPEPPENTLKNRMFIRILLDIVNKRIDPFFHQDKFINNLTAISNGKYPVKQLREIISGNLTKGSLPKQDEKDGECSVVQINSINADGTIALDDLLTAKNIFSKQQKLKIGDVLVVITGATIGKIAFWNYEGDYFLGGDIVKFQTNSLSDNAFVYQFLRCNLMQIEIKRNITGATNGHLAPEDISHLPIPVPPLSKQKEIAEHITGIRQQAQQLKDQTQELLKKASEEIEEIILS